MANQVVYGIYDSQEELNEALRTLSQRNVSQSSIQVIGEGQLEAIEERDDDEGFVDGDSNVIIPNAAVAAPGTASASVSGETAYNQGGLYAIPALYVDRGEYNQNVDLSEYADDLDDGKYLLLLDETVESRLRMSDLSATTDIPSNQDNDVNEDSTFDNTPAEDVVRYDAANDDVYDERLGSAADEVEIIETNTTTRVTSVHGENETTDLNVADDTREFPVGEQFDEQTSDVETEHLPTREEETAHIDADVQEVPVGEQFDEITSTTEVEHIPTEEEGTTHIVADDADPVYSDEVLNDEVVVEDENVPTHEEVHNTLGDKDTRVGNVDADKEDKV